MAMPRSALVWAGKLACRALPLLVSLALVSTPAANADEPHDAALLNLVKALSEKVQQLEARVGKLEGHPPVAAPAVVAPVVSQATVNATVPPAASSGYLTAEGALRANWSKITRNLDQAEVTKLLGAPTRKFDVDGRTVWYYVYPGLGVGSIFFTDSGRVSSRQWPFGWGG